MSEKALPVAVNGVGGDGEKGEPRGEGEPEREQWSNKLEFLLSVAGEIIGLGNVWRFPYLCYKNGGGAFLIPYVIFLFTCGIPMFVLETALGQYTSQGTILAWRKMCPLFEGISYASLMIVNYLNIYYIVVLAWAIFYLFNCFTAVLPWANCDHYWNTALSKSQHRYDGLYMDFFYAEGFIDFIILFWTFAAERRELCVETQNKSVNWTSSENSTSAVVEFWENRVLRLSSGLEDIGTIGWEMALCMLLAWIICYFCIWKGVKGTGKVVYFTATFPYLMLIILLVRGVTLPGAVEGIKFYIYPNISRLSDPVVWLDAGTQIFYSYAMCAGCLTALGSYNQYNNNCYKDCVALCFLNSGTSFMAGFAIFSVLGFMANEQGVPISEVAESGPGLAFIAYPKAVTMMPVSQLWGSMFFLMLIFLGLDSQFVCIESLVTAIVDLSPGMFRKRFRRELFILAIAAVSFLIGLFLVTEGGMYVFQLFDYYGAGGICLLFVAGFEAVTIGWVYGADRFYDNIEDMIGYRPWPLMKWCWMFVTPGLCAGIFLFALIDNTPLKYNNTYLYPGWGNAIGWVMACSSMIWIPLFMIYAIFRSKGTFLQRIRQLITPAKDLRQPKKSTDGKMEANNSDDNYKSDFPLGEDNSMSLENKTRF